jgi:hypothetical protein
MAGESTGYPRSGLELVWNSRLAAPLSFAANQLHLPDFVSRGFPKKETGPEILKEKGPVPP